MFDLERETVITGVVTRYEWRNPHIYIHVEGGAEGAAPAQWRIEAGPLGIMRRFGWASDSLSAGDRVTITANPSRTEGRATGFLLAIETDAGALPSWRGEAALTTLGSYAGPSYSAAEDLVGVWTTLLDVDVLGRLEEPPAENLTPAGAESVASFDETTMHPGLECIPLTAPLTMLIPDVKAIDRAGNDLRIRSEFDGAERIIHLDGDPPASPSIQGRSVGRWEGRTLLVETTGFAEHRTGNFFGAASSPQKSLREEFELAADGSALTYRFVLEDPVYLAAPIAGEVQWAFRPDLEYAGLTCDPENARSFLED